jgi:hypothetical protein
MDSMLEIVDSLDVDCPICGAMPSQKCNLNSELPRFQSHIERGWIAAMGHIRNTSKRKTETTGAPETA